MRPKEKAAELINLFLPEAIFIDAAKRCALICVDQIDTAIDFDCDMVQGLDREHAWWDQVRAAISNMTIH